MEQNHSALNEPEAPQIEAVPAEVISEPQVPVSEAAPAEDIKKKKHNGGVWVFLTILALTLVASIVIIIMGVKSNLIKGNLPDSDPVGVTDDDKPFSLIQNATPKVDYTVGEDEILPIPVIVEKVKPSIVGIVADNSFGSGFFISENGYILTNAHVIDGAANITVYDIDERSYSATLIGSDEQTDIAVIKVEGSGFPAVEIGDSDVLEIGETVVAIGNPRGMELYGTVTSGIVSGTNRAVTVGGITFDLIQTDASINGGNSGGALVNHFGQVIGVTNAKIAGSAYEGLAFAIPVSTAVPIANELIAYGKVTGRPVIGISGYDVSSYYGPGGVYVVEVNYDSDAYAKGLQAGDIITAVNGEEIISVKALSAKIGSMQAGDTVTLFVYRDGRYFTLDVKLMSND